jgi:hypothetical protein
MLLTYYTLTYSTSRISTIAKVYSCAVYTVQSVYVCPREALYAVEDFVSLALFASYGLADQGLVFGLSRL